MPGYKVTNASRGRWTSSNGGETAENEGRWPLEQPPNMVFELLDTLQQARVGGDPLAPSHGCEFVPRSVARHRHGTRTGRLIR